jgi:hypothetical protein
VKIFLVALLLISLLSLTGFALAFRGAKLLISMHASPFHAAFSTSLPARIATFIRAKSTFPLSKQPNMVS